MTGSILPGAGQRREVAPIFFQRLKFVLGIGIGHALVAAQFGQRLQDGVAFEAVALKNLLQRGAALFQQPQEQMLGADVFVAQFAGFGFGRVERFLEGRAGIQIGRGIAAGP